MPADACNIRSRHHVADRHADVLRQAGTKARSCVRMPMVSLIGFLLNALTRIGNKPGPNPPSPWFPGPGRGRRSLPPALRQVCRALQCGVLHNATLHWLQRNATQNATHTCIATRGNALQFIIPKHNAISTIATQCDAAHDNGKQCIATQIKRTRCKAMKVNAIQCNANQHIPMWISASGCKSTRHDTMQSTTK